jgi:Leucine-rich repeat (LRR) protein
LKAKRPSGAAIALERIRAEATRQTGRLDLGRLGLSDLPKELFSLTHLRILNLGSGIELPSGKWKNSQSEDRHNKFGSSISRLSNLKSLEVLSLRYTDVEDVDFLRSLSTLRWLDLSDSGVSSIQSVARLSSLERISMSRTGVRDISVLANLSELRRIHCRDTAVADISALAGLQWLQTLNISRTEVLDLSPLSGLRCLEQLSLAKTRIWNLSPVESTRLRYLNVFGSPISRVDIKLFAAALGKV